MIAAANSAYVRPDNLKRDYDRLVKLAGVPRIQDRRHTLATLSLASSANIKPASRRIGNAKTGLTLDIDAHVLPKQHRK
ncbi:MAG TPA: hypothetical protein VFE42_31655 [Chloroflexota bacterium]|nr:hypothetical protein [Chloroflexota bacterium]HZS92028.1 hypothetical protein [Chloroflexota bacterium]